MSTYTEEQSAFISGIRDAEAELMSSIEQKRRQEERGNDKIRS